MFLTRQFRTFQINCMFQSQFIIKSKHAIEDYPAASHGDLEPFRQELSDQMTGVELQFVQAKVCPLLRLGRGDCLSSAPAVILF